MLKVVSAGRDHGDIADFFVDRRKVPLENSGALSSARRGLNLLVLDAESLNFCSAWVYDTCAHAEHANAQLASDLDALEEGRVVMLAVKGSGLEFLDGPALEALRRVGASLLVDYASQPPYRREWLGRNSPLTSFERAEMKNGMSARRPGDGYALIGVKGGKAGGKTLAEKLGYSVQVEVEVACRASSRPSSRGPHNSQPESSDLSAHFEQQRRFLSDLRSSTHNPEESVSADQHQAWNLKLVAQQNEIERLRSRAAELEVRLATSQQEVAVALRERDEWKVSAQRMKMNREFQTTVASLEADHKRFLHPTCHLNSPQDFESVLKQQMKLAETPLAEISHCYDGHRSSPSASLSHHHPPPPLATFPYSVSSHSR